MSVSHHGRKIDRNEMNLHVIHMENIWFELSFPPVKMSHLTRIVSSIHCLKLISFESSFFTSLWETEKCRLKSLIEVNSLHTSHVGPLIRVFSLIWFKFTRSRSHMMKWERSTWEACKTNEVICVYSDLH